MKKTIEIDRKTYRQLRELASFESRSVSSIGNEILRAWLDQNFKSIIEELEEELDEDDDEEEDDQEEDWSDDDEEDEEEEDEDDSEGDLDGDYLEEEE